MVRLAAWIGRRSVKEKAAFVAVLVIAAVAIGRLLSFGEDGGRGVGPPAVKSGAAKWSDEIVAPYKKSKRDVYLESVAPCAIGNAYIAQPDSAALDYAMENYPPVFEQPAYEGCLAGMREHE